MDGAVGSLCRLGCNNYKLEPCLETSIQLSSSELMMVKFLNVDLEPESKRNEEFFACMPFQRTFRPHAHTPAPSPSKM
jgi:hypothetical protein